MTLYEGFFFLFGTWTLHSQRDGGGALRGLLLPPAFVIQLEQLHLAGVRPAVPLQGSLNPEPRAHLSGSGEVEPPLKAAEAQGLWVAQQTCVVQLHQHDGAGKVPRGVEPGNSVEVRRTGSAGDDVTTQLHVLALLHEQRRLFWIHLKVIFWMVGEEGERKSVK